MATDSREVAGAGLGSSTLPLVLIAAMMIVGIAALLPLMQSSGAATTGGNIRRLEQERSDWQAQLQAQELKVAQLASLSRIEQEATTRLRMVQPAEVYYFRVDTAPPAPHQLPSRFLPQSEQSADTGSSLWDDIAGWLP